MRGHGRGGDSRKRKNASSGKHGLPAAKKLRENAGGAVGMKSTEEVRLSPHTPLAIHHLRTAQITADFTDEFHARQTAVFDPAYLSMTKYCLLFDDCESFIFESLKPVIFPLITQRRHLFKTLRYLHLRVEVPIEKDAFHQNLVELLDRAALLPFLEFLASVL